MTGAQQRAALQKKIWDIANDVRGAVDGWDFKQYVLGTLFYRFISENFALYIEAGDESIRYAELDDNVISPEIKDDAIKTKGYFVYPSQLFANVVETANTNENLNTALAAVFAAIESSANGYPSEDDIKGLFADFDTTSNRLGNTVKDKNERLAKVLKRVAELDFGDFEGSQIDLFGDAYEFLISNYAANAGKSGGEFFTPQQVSKLISMLAMHKQTKINKILDHACGSGSLLLRAKKQFDEHIIEEGFFGQEVNHTTYNLARMNMFLHNINYDKFNIRLGNTLTDPQFADEKPFDAIVSNPPYSVKWIGSDDPTLINDERFAPAGVLPPKSKADFAFVLHALYYLSSKGRAAIVCFPGIFYRGGAEQKIRKYLVDNNYVETVISLAPNLFYGTTIAVNILVLSKHKTDTTTQFIDASGLFKKETNNNTLTDDHIETIMQVANTTQRDKNSFDFTMNWAKADNGLIKDLKDFTATFFQKSTLLEVLLKYSVFDVSNTLLVMRPYQIAATERILWKTNSSYIAKTWSKPESGGYIWHTTGSGKTLTSFKAARLATELDFIDKVFFVVDRKDLDYQTMKEYQRFSPDSVNGSESTAGLKRNLDKDDNKIIVTTIQKLNNLMKGEGDLPIYSKQVVFIFDECHRSQFGEAQKNLKKKFKRFYQFGFTGTPIFPQNALGAETTASVFGRELHSYVITDAIRDEKVLKFKVDYNDVRPQFKAIETEQDERKLTAAENRQALLHPQRIKEISQYILTHYRQKTHRLRASGAGFNAMFAVSSVDAAKLYYESLKQLQADSDKPLRVATIFSFAANEEQDAIGDIQDESFDVSAMNSSAKEFLNAAIADYNGYFKTSFSVDSNGFQNYYRDLAKRVKSREIDLLIVVGMFLTGFDAPTLNTLFVDKNLRYHGLIQAYSRTNRIGEATSDY